MSDGHRPRVMIVGAFPPPNKKVFGGIVTSCRTLTQSSLSTELELDLVDTTQVSNPPPPLLVRLLLAMRRFGGFVARIHRHRPDAVLLFSAAGASLVEKGAMAWVARLYGVPALMFPRGGVLIEQCRNSAWSRRWTRLCFSGARMVLCQGPAWQVFATDVLGFTRANAPIIENWTATGEFLAIGRARTGAAREPVRLLFVGWLDREKGVAELLEASRQLSAARPLTLTFVGEGNMSEIARAYVKTHGMDAMVKFCGWLAGSDLRNQYAEADVFVLPSWAEGLPNAMIEGMAARLAIVVSAVGTIPDVIQSGANGLLVSPRDSNELRVTLERVVSDARLRETLGDAAFATAMQRFSVERAVEGLVAAVRTVTAARPRHAEEQALMSHPEDSLGFRVRKLMRFISIYGPGRSLFKVAGRLRIRPIGMTLRRTKRDVGIIGCGQFAFATIGYFLNREFGARIAACYDIDANAASSLARSLAVPHVCASASELLDTPGLRTVYIASNHASHAQYAAEALARGYDVYVEKPVAVTEPQFVNLMRARASARGRLFAGYNRPFSGAVRALRKRAHIDKSVGITLQCFVAGHRIAPEHWYRRPEEGTRVCGNLGHWLDLFVHVLAWRGMPDQLEIALSWADDSEPDDNLTVAIRSDRGDLFSVMLSSRAEPFEGINETINFQHGDTICKIDDFRRMHVWQGTSIWRRRFWPKDVGHRLAILQPFRQDSPRDWQEVVHSTLLMLHITELVRNRQPQGKFSFVDSLARIARDHDSL